MLDIPQQNPLKYGFSGIEYIHIYIYGLDLRKPIFRAELQIFRNTEFNYLKCCILKEQVLVCIHYSSTAIHSLVIHQQLLSG